MTAVPVLSRRSVGCVSDLTIDRWLLGETPGSDEARRVEEHVKRCAPCASRLGALRGLYSTQVPAARHEPPVPLDAVPAQAPGMSGALQFVILRDGLLVGSEFFTPGTYMIGSDARADLQLDGVLPLHARIYFRDGRVAVKAEAGALYVNGFKVDSCELRAIDEVLVGPYVLRCRVLRERWSDVEVGTARAPSPRPEPTEETVTVRTELPEATVIEPPPARAVAKTRLTAELWWGDARQAARSVEATLTVRDFPLWGFSAPDDFVLAEPGEQGAWVIHPPPGTGAERTLSSGERVVLKAGVMQLVLRVDPVLERLPAAPMVSWPTVLLAGVLLVAFFATMALAPPPDEDRFTPHDFKREVTLVFPKAPPKPTPVVVDREPSSHRQDPEVKAPARRPATPPPPRPTNRFSAVDKLLKGGAVRSMLDSTKAQPAGKPTAGRGKPGWMAGLGIGGGGAKGLDLGIRGDGGPGIGAGGAKNSGAMTGGGFGKGPIGGRVLRPVATGISTPPGATSSIDKDAVAKAIADHLAEISSCYERGLVANGHSGGRLALEWTITTSGVVAQAKVKSSTLGDATVASCVMAHLKTWTFPKARGGAVVVSYPFVFQSSDYR
jgi:hypothetical protein